MINLKIFSKCIMFLVVLEAVCIPHQMAETNFRQQNLQTQDRLTLELININVISNQITLVPNRDCVVSTVSPVRIEEDDVYSIWIQMLVALEPNAKAYSPISLPLKESKAFWYQTPLEEYRTTFWVQVKFLSDPPAFSQSKSLEEDFTFDWRFRSYSQVSSEYFEIYFPFQEQLGMWYQVDLTIKRRNLDPLIYLLLPVAVILSLIWFPPKYLRISELARYLQIYTTVAVFSMTFFIGLRSTTPPVLTWIDLIITAEIIWTTGLMLYEIRQYSRQKNGEIDDATLAESLCQLIPPSLHLIRQALTRESTIRKTSILELILPKIRQHSIGRLALAEIEKSSVGRLVLTAIRRTHVKEIEH